MKSLLAAVGLLVAFALPASAQQLKLHISDGRVTLEAVNVSARQILAEWARIGGTKVVGADKITGAALTLKLVDTPEQQALDIILRSVAGFIAAPRTTKAAAGASTYDRILIMATSANAAQAGTGAARGVAPGSAGNLLNGTQRRVPPRPPNLPPSVADDVDDQDDSGPDPTDNGVQQPVFTFPNPANGVPGANNPVFVPMQNGQQFGAPANGQTPVITLQPGPNGPTIYNFTPNGSTTPPPTTPTTPFGAIGAPTPGMIQTPPPTTGPGQPTPVRPPR